MIDQALNRRAVGQVEALTFEQVDSHIRSPAFNTGTFDPRHSNLVSSIAPSPVATTSGSTDNISPGTAFRTAADGETRNALAAEELVSAHHTIRRASLTSENAPGYGSVTARIRLKICSDVCVQMMRPSSAVRPPKYVAWASSC